MPYRKVQFANNEIYHIVVRAIDNNTIFKDIDDNYRGIFSIYEFNNAKPVVIRERRRVRAKIKKEFKKITPKLADRDPVSADFREKLVEVLAFCIMPNHIHLLVKQLKEGGVTKFMAKIGAGYGGYFNRKYSRKGPLFQNRFGAIHIRNDKQLGVVFAYIHANPASLIEPKWKELGIKNFKKCTKFLENYKWSSYLDYIGRVNFPSVTDRKFMLELMAGEINCKNCIEDYLKYKGRVREIDILDLE